MLKCPSCGFSNLDYRERCLKCRARLVPDARFSEMGASPEQSPRRSLPWPPIALMQAWRRLARAFAVPLPEGVPHRYPLLAAFLGLVPGLGQVYNHQPRKALYFLPLLALLLALTICFITTPFLGTLLIAATLAVPLLSFWDALTVAAQINGSFFTLRNQLAAMTYPFFLLGLVGCICALLSFMGWPFFTLYYVGGDYMGPALERGDRICGEAVTYWNREPQPGDVVRYDPPQYRIEVPHEVISDNYIINAKNGWERVMAVGGETLEYRDERYFVDGRELNPEYYPLVSGQVYNQFTITCPPGQYIVLISARAVDNSWLNALRGQTEGMNALTPIPGTPEAAAASLVPDFNEAGVIVKGWPEACCVPRGRIFDRTWFTHYPGPRRRFFQAEGPRFVE